MPSLAARPIGSSAQPACKNGLLSDNLVPGGNHFFTVNLAERRLGLLTENIGLLQTAFRQVRARHPFTIEAAVILLNHLHAIWPLPEHGADFALRWRVCRAAKRSPDKADRPPPSQNDSTTAAQFPAAFLLSKGHRHADHPFHRQQSTDPLAGADAFRSVHSHSAKVQAAGRLLFISGQFGAAPDRKLLGEFAPQCEQAVENVGALLSAGGMTTVNIGGGTLPRSGRMPAPEKKR